jgi:hypothetical protein
LTRDGVIYCDAPGCPRKVEALAQKRKAEFEERYSRTIPDYCTSHQNNYFARLINAAKERKRNEPRQEEKPANTAQSSASVAASYEQVAKDGAKSASVGRYTTVGKVATLFGVKPATIREHLLAHGYLTAIKLEDNPTLYISKEEVRTLVLLGHADSSRFKVIPELTRKMMFEGPGLFQRLYQGVLD